MGKAQKRRALRRLEQENWSVLMMEPVELDEIRLFLNPELLAQFLDPSLAPMPHSAQWLSRCEVPNFVVVEVGQGKRQGLVFFMPYLHRLTETNPSISEPGILLLGEFAMNFGVGVLRSDEECHAVEMTVVETFVERYFQNLQTLAEQTGENLWLTQRSPNLPWASFADVLIINLV